MKELKYRGSLTLLQLKDASIKALQNARELLDEAQILYNHDCYARAFFLLRISNEELGKFFIVLETIVMQIEEKEIDWKIFWLRLNKHEEKTYISDSMASRFFNDGINQFVDGDLSKATPFWELMKLASIYVDIHGSIFRLPSEFITLELVNPVLESTRKRIEPLDKYDFENFIESISKNKNASK